MTANGMLTMGWTKFYMKLPVCYSSRLRSEYRYLILAIGVIVALLPIAALAQSMGTNPGNAVASTNIPLLPNPAVMVLHTAAILILGGGIARALWHFDFFRNMAWILVMFGIVSGIAWFVTGQFYSSGEMPLRYARFVTFFVCFILILYILLRAVLPTHASRARAAIPALLRDLAIFISAFIALFVMIVTLFPEINLTPVFFTSGIVSIVIGLAVQDVLSNLLAGLVLSLDRPFEIGDWVHLGQNEGEVVRVTWRTTKLRTFENDFIELPNSMIAKEKIANHHAPTTVHMRKILVGVTYDTPPGIATAALLDAAAKVNGVMTSPAPEVLFKDYLDSSVLFELRVWIDNYGSYPVIESNIRREIWYSFKRHDITIPFPVRDVNLRQIVDPPELLYARLIGQKGINRQQVYELNPGRSTIGREPGNAVCLQDPQVSKVHATIEQENNRFLLRDQQSRHGTYLNGGKISEAPLRRGDEITFGSITLTFETNAVPATEDTSKRPRIRTSSTAINQSAQPENPAQGDTLT
jgi:small-conductance mechanosensitive channel